MIKPNLSRGGDGKLRVLMRDSRVAWGRSPGFFVFDDMAGVTLPIRDNPCYQIERHMNLTKPNLL
jgi:hypothetical protein